MNFRNGVASLVLGGLIVAGGTAVGVAVSRPTATGPVAVTPLSVTRPVLEALDVVFVADAAYVSEAAFRADAELAIRAGIERSAALTANRPLLNFWLASARGRIGRCPDGATWPRSRLPNWADAFVMLHRSAWRDCYYAGHATANVSRDIGGANLVHELGHALFGLPDEYQPGGGYWSRPPVLVQVHVGSGSLAAYPTPKYIVEPMSTPVVWLRGEGPIDIMGYTNDAGVPEFGRLDWQVMATRLGRIGSGTVATPAVFAPDAWPKSVGVAPGGVAPTP